MPPTSGPMAQLRFSTPWSKALARGSSVFGTRFGSPAKTAGRKKPVARPATAARATTVPAFGAKGSATKTPTRTASAAIIRERRSSRSRSGPSRSPTMIVGRNSTITTAATHGPEFVRCWTSIASATAAISVPALEASVAKKRLRNPGSLSGESWAGESLTAAPESTTDAGALRDARKDVSQPDGEELVLLRSSDGDADRLGRAEAVQRTDDDALPLQPLEQLSPSSDVGEEEVAARRLD